MVHLFGPFFAGILIGVVSDVLERAPWDFFAMTNEGEREELHVDDADVLIG